MRVVTICPKSGYIHRFIGNRYIAGFDKANSGFFTVCELDKDVDSLMNAVNGVIGDANIVGVYCIPVDQIKEWSMKEEEEDIDAETDQS